MNTISINLSKSNKHILPFSSDKESSNIFYDLGIEKSGWSFFNIYYFEELRNFFLAINKNPIQYKTYKEYELICKNLPYVEKPWSARRIEEYANALRNMAVINKDGIIINPLNFKSEVNEDLTEVDFEIFKSIYLSYFRFKEIFGWFINPFESGINRNFSEEILAKESKITFSIANHDKFVDSLFYNLVDNTDVFEIKSEIGKTADSMKRFWDVFCKWGYELNLLQKFNLDYFGIKTTDNKSISCTYFINNEKININLKDFIVNNFKNKYIYVPDLILKLILKYRCSVDSAKSFILNEYEKDKFSYSLDRTSEIFIKKGKINSKDVIFHPEYRNAYISHLIVLK